MAANLTSTHPDFTRGARAASVAAGVAMLWRALGAPPLGPVILGLGGLALIWHGFAASPAHRSEPSAATRRRSRADGDAVQRTSEDSFPASDPPSWTPTTGSARRH